MINIFSSAFSKSLDHLFQNPIPLDAYGHCRQPAYGDQIAYDEEPRLVLSCNPLIVLSLQNGEHKCNPEQQRVGDHTVDVLHKTLEHDHGEDVEEGQESDAYPESDVLFFGEEGGHPDHDRDDDPEEEVLDVVADYGESLVVEAVFEAEVQVLFFEFVESAAEEAEVDCPEHYLSDNEYNCQHNKYIISGLTIFF